jgi:sugar phosphate isomerase/epimerase
MPIPPPLDPRTMFAIYRLLAWCIVPFDRAKRTPVARAAMLQQLGFRKFAYDWRAEHLPQFDAEAAALKAQGVAMSAVWFPAHLGPDAQRLLAGLAKHGLKSELWVMLGAPPAAAKTDAARIAWAADALAPIAAAAARINAKVGLYNHGGWAGEPESMIAAVAALKARGYANVGIVYNQHHGHDHAARFAAVLPALAPHLLALNLNGMDRDGERRGRKILPLGQGELDESLLRTILAGPYRGPFGILGHTDDDAEDRLRDNLDGLAWLVKKIAGTFPGPKPIPRTPMPSAKQ